MIEKRINPSDGNAMYFEDWFDEGNVVITDIFGGHRMTLSLSEWRSWKLVK